MPNTFFQVGRISVAVKTHLEIRLGICIYKTSLLHRPDGYIGFTRNCPPTFYNKIAPMVGSDNNWRRLQILETSLIQEHKPKLNANIPSMPLYIFNLEQSFMPHSWRHAPSPSARIQLSHEAACASRHFVSTETALCVFHFSQHFSPEWLIRTCSMITAVQFAVY